MVKKNKENRKNITSIVNKISDHFFSQRLHAFVVIWSEIR